MSRFITATLLTMALILHSGCSRTPEDERGSDSSSDNATPGRSEPTTAPPDEAIRAEPGAPEQIESNPPGVPAEARSADAITAPRLMGEESVASRTGERPAVREPSEPRRTGGSSELEPREGEVSLGQARVGRMKVDLVQRPGRIAGGQEAHLIVALPDAGGGDTIVRAWLGTMDRAKWEVATAEYLPAANRYDVGITAPDPVPAGAMWWIEIETPDGRKAIGAAEPARN